MKLKLKLTIFAIFLAAVGFSQSTTRWQTIYINVTHKGKIRIQSGPVIVGDTTDCDSTALMELKSTTKGFLPPRMTTTQRNAISGTGSAGLLLYNTTKGTLNFYNGSKWVSTPTADSGTANYLTKYSTAQNIGNSQIFDNGTNIGIGTATPLHTLDIQGAARLDSAGWTGYVGNQDIVILGVHHFLSSAKWVHTDDSSNIFTSGLEYDSTSQHAQGVFYRFNPTTFNGNGVRNWKDTIELAALVHNNTQLGRMWLLFNGTQGEFRLQTTKYSAHTAFTNAPVTVQDTTTGKIDYGSFGLPTTTGTALQVLTSRGNGSSYWSNNASYTRYNPGSPVAYGPRSLSRTLYTTNTSGEAIDTLTTDGTAGGTALFDSIYSIQVTTYSNDTTFVSHAVVYNVAAGNKTIILRAVGSDGTTPAPVGTRLYMRIDGQ